MRLRTMTVALRDLLTKRAHLLAGYELIIVLAVAVALGILLAPVLLALIMVAGPPTVQEPPRPPRQRQI